MCEALKSIQGVIAFPTRSSTRAICVASVYDRDLFDGEAALSLPCQDTLIGGGSEFLFDQKSVFEHSQKAA